MCPLLGTALLIYTTYLYLQKVFPLLNVQSHLKSFCFSSGKYRSCSGVGIGYLSPMPLALGFFLLPEGLLAALRNAGDHYLNCPLLEDG